MAKTKEGNQKEIERLKGFLLDLKMNSENTYLRELRKEYVANGEVIQWLKNNNLQFISLKGPGGTKQVNAKKFLKDFIEFCQNRPTAIKSIHDKHYKPGSLASIVSNGISIIEDLKKLGVKNQELADFLKVPITTFTRELRTAKRFWKELFPLGYRVGKHLREETKPKK